MVNIYLVELKRILASKKYLLVILLLMALKVVYICMNMSLSDTRVNEEIYENYMKELSGVYTEEKYAYIDETLEYYREAQKNFSMYQTKYLNGEIDMDTYRFHRGEKELGDARVPTLTVIQTKANYFKTSYNDGEFFYDLDVEIFIDKSDIDFFAYAIVFVIVSLLFLSDYSNETKILIYSSRYGRSHINTVRIHLAIIMSVVFAALLQVTEIITFIVMNNPGDLTAPIRSIMLYSMAIDVSIIEYIVIVALTRILFTACGAVIIAALTMIIHKFVPLLVTALAILLIPMAIESFVPSFLKCIFLHRGLSASDMYLMSDKIGDVYNFIITSGMYIVLAMVLYFLITREKRILCKN